MGELFQFPFQASIWGTVADWAIVAVTAATLWYLVKTLRSQLKVQELQQKSTAIQNSMYLREFRPSFVLQRCVIEPAGVGTDKEYQQIVVLLQLEGNDCLDLDYDFSDVRSNGPFQPKADKLFVLFSEVLVSSHAIVIVTNDPLETPLPSEFYLTVGLTYKDHSDNRYKQTISIRKKLGAEILAEMRKSKLDIPSANDRIKEYFKNSK